MFCEEFEGATLTPKKPALPRSAQEPATRESGHTGKLRGLCRTCERRDTCTYPKPEGGVWHCEEFK